MKIKYFQDTDTLYIEFCVDQIAETRDLDENTLLELDDQGRVCAAALAKEARWVVKRHEEMPRTTRLGCPEVTVRKIGVALDAGCAASIRCAKMSP